ncbi:glutathione S-transferase zeta class-like [Impatiens glandulifera]|uniref:glutathione S-transferase zeta class-like n=1 Tax=Impatiens glandulifera TaxID=253017 RepID=UPI001FB11539|nr:glutathione S-transferase zeta class-like [Impatiens glandulifera]
MASSGATEVKKLKLYSYWRSSCSFRVRIALNLKGLDYEYLSVDLLKGDNHDPEFKKVNPIGYVPALIDEDVLIADSLAIILYLEEKYPQHHPLLPRDLKKKAINYQAANIIGSSIQPHQNLSVLKFIEEKIGPYDKVPWVQSQIEKGFSAVEKVLHEHAGKYATGDEVCLADVYLAPQIHTAIDRFEMDMSKFPLLSKLYEAYMELPAFVNALPKNQPDAPPPQC